MAKGSNIEVCPDMVPCSTNQVIFKPTRLGRVPKQTVFSDSVIQLVIGFKAVHLKEDESGLVQAPTPPFESMTLEEAMKEDTPK